MYKERKAISFIGQKAGVCACCCFILFKFIMCIACHILICFPLVFERMRLIQKQVHIYMYSEIVICDMRKEHDPYVLAQVDDMIVASSLLSISRFLNVI
jgi:hypothetical protein